MCIWELGLHRAPRRKSHWTFRQVGRIHSITEKQKVEKSGGGGVGDDELNEKPKMTQERKYNTQ